MASEFEENDETLEEDELEAERGKREEKNPDFDDCSEDDGEGLSHWSGRSF